MSIEVERNPIAVNALARLQEAMSRMKEDERTNRMNVYLSRRYTDVMSKAIADITAASMADDVFTVGNILILVGRRLAIRAIMGVTGADQDVASKVTAAYLSQLAEVKEIEEEGDESVQEDENIYRIVKEYLDGVYTVVKEYTPTPAWGTKAEANARKEWEWRTKHGAEDLSDIEDVWGDPSTPGHPWNPRSDYNV